MDEKELEIGDIVEYNGKEGEIIEIYDGEFLILFDNNEKLWVDIDDIELL